MHVVLREVAEDRHTHTHTHRAMELIRFTETSSLWKSWVFRAKGLRTAIGDSRWPLLVEMLADDETSPETQAKL